MVILVNWLSAKVKSCITDIDDGIITLCRLLLTNDQGPKFVTEEGMVTLASLLRPKHCTPMLWTEEGIMTRVSKALP